MDTHTVRPRGVLALLPAWIVNGGGLYPASAALFLIGCYLLTADAYNSGVPFAKAVLTTIATLQFYELLVIASAVFIVRRLKRLDDALVLAVIQLVLIFDPTFQSTYLSVADPPRALTTGLVLPMLAPVKLLLLCRWLHLRASLRTVLTVLLACMMASVVEGLALSSEIQPTRRALPFLALSWFPVVLALVLPRPLESLAIVDDRESFATESQREILPWLAFVPLCLLPLGHLVGSGLVFDVPFCMAHVAPVLLGAAILTVRISITIPVLLVSGLLAAALGASSGFFDAIHGIHESPLLQPVPLSAAWVTAGLVCWSGWRRWLDKRFVAALFALGGCIMAPRLAKVTSHAFETAANIPAGAWLIATGLLIFAAGLGFTLYREKLLGEER